MAVSKRTRFEVLRRDGYACRYCRATDSPLTIDHVLPVSLGGGDTPDNLVACCRDCNAGKGASTPDSELVDQVDEDAERWAAARQRAIEKIRREHEMARERRATFLEGWHLWDEGERWLPANWETRIDAWLGAGLTMAQLCDALKIAVFTEKLPAGRVFRYMAGIVNRMLSELDDATASELRAE